MTTSGLSIPRVIASGALAECGDGSGTTSGGGSGKTLTVYVGAQPNDPKQFQQWSKGVRERFRAATGANLPMQSVPTQPKEQ